jgi:hypothetical protein
VPQGDQPSSVVVAGQVQHDRPQVRRSLALVVDPARRPGQADEGLLHEVLRRVAVVDEQPRQADQGTAFGLEQVDEQPVEVGGDGRRAHGHGAEAERGGNLDHPRQRTESHRSY